jgi:perosamine synthetase
MPCEIDRILRLAQQPDLLALQDAACALGSRFRGDPVGYLSPVAAFSLHARNVVTTGEGGIIVTNDAEFAVRLRRLRHPTITFERYQKSSYNFRMTDIQAVIGLCQLNRLDEMLAASNDVPRSFQAVLISNRRSCHITFSANWQSYQIRVRAGGRFDRSGLMEALHAAGIATRRGVMASDVELPYLAMDSRFPTTEAAAVECLQLAIHFRNG